MRHRKRRAQMSMMPSHRKAALRSIVRSLLRFERIETTMRKAKEARRLAEKLITSSKDDSVNSRRHAFSVLTDRDLVSKLFKEISPLFKSRTSGYTRIVPIGFRRGDGASMVILELVEKTKIEKAPKKKAKAKAEEPKEEAKELKEEARLKSEHREKEPKAKSVPKSKPTLDEEKKTEKAKVEDKKMDDQKKFLKNLRGFFHRKTDM